VRDPIAPGSLVTSHVDEPVVRRSTRTVVRPEIQALRALAVALVVVYHLWPRRLPGGYVGVDAFFAISGFLITGHLLREIDRTGTVRVAEFWARRIRRLLPASLLVVAVTGLITWAAVPQRLWPSFFHEIGAATLYVENWSLAVGAVDYLTASNTATPVQHFWSLSTEEQFYLVWPLLMIAIVVLSRRLPRPVVRRRITAVLAVVVGASLVYSIVFTRTDPAFAYFITPTRAWEFGLGGLLAALAGEPKTSRRTLRTLVSWAGFVAVLLASFRYTSATPFPGSAAALPVVGTLAVLWAGDTTGRLSLGPLTRLRPVQWLGDVSYSLYLWHWPLIVLVPIVLGTPLTTPLKLLILVLSVVLAWASKVLVEDRFRERGPLAARRPRWTFGATAIAMSVVLLGTGLVGVALQNAAAASEKVVAAVQKGDVPACLGALALTDPEVCADHTTTLPVAPGPAGAATDLSGAYSPACWQGEYDEGMKDCVSGDVGSPVKVALIGDSHAASWYSTINTLASRRGWELHTFFKSTCPFTQTQYVSPSVQARSCSHWNDDVLRATRSSDFSLVLVSAARTRYGYGSDSAARIEKGYRASWAGVGHADGRVVVLRDIPTLTEKALDCASSCSISQASALGGPTDYAFRAAISARSADIVPLDMTKYFCASGSCQTIVGGVRVYRDTSSHMTNTYALTLVSALQRELAAAGALPPSPSSR
jgi:peptidoglycan/LPS O-acetylase OafA/YrhL